MARTPRVPTRASVKKSTIAKAARGHNKIAKQAVRTNDSYQNTALALGMGTPNQLSASTYGFNPITRIRTLIEWIYRGNWLGSIAVDIIADDMTRAGIDVNADMDAEDLNKLRQGENDLNMWGSINETIKWARLYGGCIMVMLIDGQDMSTPLRPNTVGPNGLRGFLVLDRWMVDTSMSQLVAEFGPDIGQPMYYTVNADASALRGVKIHYSRVLRMMGDDLPYWQRVQENLWGLSVFERIYDRMVALDSATQGAAQLVYKSFLRTFKMKGLTDLLSNGGDEGVAIVMRRVDQVRRNQSNEGMSVVDADDDITVQQSGGYAGLTDVILQFIQQVSGTLGVPLVRMLGQSPAGLNSSGESDLRTYYDGINQKQERRLRRGVTTIYRVMARSLMIELGSDWSFSFTSLWQLDEVQKSEISARDATSIAEMEEAGLIDKPTAMRELKQNSRMTNRFDTITDEMIVAAQNEPPELPGMGLSDDEIEAAGGDPENHTHENPANDPPPKKPPVPAKSSGNGSKPTGLDRARDSLPAYHVCGVQVKIENIAGSVRKGPGWEVVMAADYGYIPCVDSAEGPMEWMDCFVGPNRDSEVVFVFDTLDPRTGRFDEHKCMMGFDSEIKAREIFCRSYSDQAKQRIGGVTRMEKDTFQAWLRSGNHKKPVSKRYQDVA